jgi:hypothetical protein
VLFSFLKGAFVMAVARHRFGAQLIVRVPVDSATAISAGDCLFWDTDDAKPASSETWGADFVTTQSNFVNHFLGIAQADHVANSAAVNDFPVDISPLAVYEMDSASETHEVGDTLGMDKAAGNALLPATLEKAVAAACCFRCVRRDAAASTRVYVTMQSAYWGINDATRQ